MPVMAEAVTVTDPVFADKPSVVAVVFVFRKGPSLNVMLVMVHAVSDVRVIFRGGYEGWCIGCRRSARISD